MRFDVVIVGAGIGGAVLALDLGRRGWTVALVEREAAPVRLARPEVLWGATPRALERLGVADAIRQTASVPLTEITIGGETPWLRFSAGDFAAAGVDAWSTNPATTRAIIADAAAATGKVETHRGVTVVELVREHGRVAGVRGTRGEDSVTFAAALVVGDDGGPSIVRRQLRVPLAFSPFPIEFITAAVARWPLPPGQTRVWIRDGGASGLGAAALFPWPAEAGVLLLPVPSPSAARVLEMSADAFWDAVARITPLAPRLREQIEFPRDFARVARPFGHAASYVTDGAALIGDAAHPMTPAGGQGANAAIWDALALADVADAALRAGDVGRDRLLAYERLRRPINDRSVSISRRARLAFEAGRRVPVRSLLPILARTVNTLRWPKRRILATFAGTFAHPPAGT